ncbi:hypothetical protein THAOC_01485 [Thalassiosira oceanica]|uniref:ASCH domain-containing protein n=1 Tax=Thalassiosira oceanica TaxID=159749 RepID=K0TH77_THAOC|nr:hypothetical protein THAOC_01485 [Thalassiosira oceanica]|eukprot:EJK76735.1 hypothetical protein THAOC_01485 [Thalassiosira oceanica]
MTAHLVCVPASSEHILTGNKTIETRTYDIPKYLLSQGDSSVRIAILETARGSDGVSSIPDRVKLGTNMKQAGWMTIVRTFKYESQSHFDSDTDKHLVDPASNYGYCDGKDMYGWVIGSKGRCPTHDQGQVFAERRMRSIFEIVAT